MRACHDLALILSCPADLKSLSLPGKLFINGCDFAPLSRSHIGVPQTQFRTSWTHGAPAMSSHRQHEAIMMMRSSSRHIQHACETWTLNDFTCHHMSQHISDALESIWIQSYMTVSIHMDLTYGYSHWRYLPDAKWCFSSLYMLSALSHSLSP